MKCATVTCNKPAKPNKVGSTLCYFCYLDKKTPGIGALRKTTLTLRNINRHRNNAWNNRRRRRQGFQCEMGYGDCEQRGYCNGDC